MDLVTGILGVCTCLGLNGQDALLQYVRSPEPGFAYRIVKTAAGPGYRTYVLDLTTVTWPQNHAKVDRTLWRHWLTIVVPQLCDSHTGFLWIDGGSNNDPPPETADPVLALFAITSGTVVADLRMVPNQPLTFADDERPRYEDAIIAYTFNKYLATQDANWPLLFPMTKSAILAMDAVQSFVQQATGTYVDEFVVAGASKRGWTTYLTGAADTRVIAIAPLVIDVLNMSAQMRHHYSAYGFFSEAVRDYEQMDIFCQLDTPAGQRLQGLVDPFAYRHRLAIPKLLINACGDQFFLPDAARMYLADLPGPTYLCYCPNADHGLSGSDATEVLLWFYRAVVARLPMPQFEWSADQAGTIRVRTSDRPDQVRLWQATNPIARDFRMQTIGRAWTSQVLQAQGPGLYLAAVARPASGWTAFFVELTYTSHFAGPIRLTTAVSVVPDCLPYAYRLGLDQDWDVDLCDLAILADQWLTSGHGADIAPICGDGWVDLRDYALLASQAKGPGCRQHTSASVR